MGWIELAHELEQSSVDGAICSRGAFLFFFFRFPLHMPASHSVVRRRRRSAFRI